MQTAEGVGESVGEADAESGEKLDLGEATTGTMDCGEGMGACAEVIDLLFIVDNSHSMAIEQQNLARNMPKLVRWLEELTDSAGNPVAADVHIMVTTTDSGNVLCDKYYTTGRFPENGAPISDACTERLGRFVTAQESFTDACTSVCPMPLAPSDSYIAFSETADNVPDVGLPADVDYDGLDDSPVAQTLACVGPQGIDGCGYESPLESMLQALDPAAEWNQGSAGFLRPNSLLAIAIITDEADCSVIDQSLMMDPSVQEISPLSGTPAPSSAICWNAGVRCDGPDVDGVYTNCRSSDETRVRPVQEHIDFLAALDRRVVMLGILGIPIVTERNPDPPYQPLAGGLLDLVYRDWRDPQYPAGDILPEDWAKGARAEEFDFSYGIGPGCTGQDEDGNFTGQGIPSVRVTEVCQSLDIADDPDTPADETELRCCMESICDTDYRHALRCLTGLIEESIVPTG
jgi:hypothetical protein